mgnify:CR=1 FL=1
MLSYILRRMFGIIVMLILLSMFTFALSRSVPGGPWMQNADIPLPPEQVEAFKAKYNLPFALLSDPDHRVADMYGAWGEKKMFGKSYEGILRSTFIVDEEGTIVKVFPKVTPKGHSREVLAALQS